MHKLAAIATTVLFAASPLLATPPAHAVASATTPGIAARRAGTFCGIFTERRIALVNHTHRARVFVVHQRTENTETGLYRENRDRIWVQPHSTGSVSIYTDRGERSRVQVTFRGELLYRAANLRPVCW